MKKVYIIVIIAVLILSLAGIFIGGTYFTNAFVEEEVSKLKASITYSEEYFSYSELRDLPFILQRYLKYSVKNGTKKPEFVRFKMKGEYKLKLDSEWMPITAEEYYSVNNPGFVWNAKLKFFGPIWMNIIDTYVNNNGSRLTKLFSSVTIRNVKGKELDQSYLVRYLLESIFCPTLLLTEKNVKWQTIDQLRARAIIWDKSQRTAVDFFFNERAEVIKIESEDRYRINDVGFERAKFTIHLANYKEFNSIKIPAYIETQWNLPGNNFTFGKFEITNIDYDISSLY